MTALSVYARLVNLTTNAVIATTTNLLKGSINRPLDKPGARSITVPLGDAGAGTDVASGFANAALAAVGGNALSSTPVPTLCEVSLDGGTTIDARFVVEKVTPDLQSGQLVLVVEGDAAGATYATIGVDRFPARDIALVDVLGGTLDGIIPMSSAYYGISSTDVIYGLQGILNTVPGNDPPAAPLWVDAAQDRFEVTGVISNDLSSAIAHLGVNLDSWEDTTGRLITSLVKLLGGVFFSADSAVQGSRGHAVWCDSDVNLSGDLAGVVCDGTPFTASWPTAAGEFGYSNDATHHPTGIANALVIGNVGGNPHGNAFTFEGNTTAPLDPASEDATVHIFADQTQMQPDLTPLYGEVRLTGGTNDAGLLPAEQITSIVTLSNVPQCLLYPNSCAGTPKTRWRDVLAVIGTNLNNQTGGLYFDAGDGRLRRVPSWTSPVPVYDLTVNNQAGIIYAATNQGVFQHATVGLDYSTTLWTRVGGLSYPVAQLSGVGAEDDFYLWARVSTSSGTSSSSSTSNSADGIYQYDTVSPSDVVGASYDHWTRHQVSADSFCAVSDHEYFFITKGEQVASLHYYDGSNSTTPSTTWALGTGVTGIRVDRVLTAAGQDSVWVATSGGAQPGQYLLFNGDGSHMDWTHQTLQPIDAAPGTGGSALDVAVGVATGLQVEPQINRAVPLGYGIQGITVAVMLCTNSGVYYMSGTIPGTGGINWSPRANGLNGLAGLSISNLVAGRPGDLPNPWDPTTYVTAARIYAISGTTFFYSYSDSRYWRDLLREPLVLGPYFYDLAASFVGSWVSGGTPGSAGSQTSAVIDYGSGSTLVVGQIVLIDSGVKQEAVTLTAVSGTGPYTCSFTTTLTHTLAVPVLGDLPPYSIQTIGPGSTSPLGATAATTHIQVAGCLPDGWYWRRRWNACYEPHFALINGNVPWPAQLDEQITEVAVTPSVDIETASADLALFFVLLLGLHSMQQAQMTVQYAFSTQEGGPRYIWPTHGAALSQTGTINMVSSDGTHLITTTYIDAESEALYVIDHTIAWDGPLFTCTTVLAPNLRGTPLTGADLAAALVQDLRRIRVHGLRKKRQ